MTETGRQVVISVPAEGEQRRPVYVALEVVEHQACVLSYYSYFISVVVQQRYLMRPLGTRQSHLRRIGAPGNPPLQGSVWIVDQRSGKPPPPLLPRGADQKFQKLPKSAETHGSKAWQA